MTTAEKTPSTIVRCAAGQKANRVRPAAHGTPRCGACHKPLPWLVDATDATFDVESRASVPVLVDLWAPWCGPCQTMGPALEQLARERAGRLGVKVNVGEEPHLAGRFAVQGIPLLMLLDRGEEIARLTGAAPLPRLSAWLNSQLTLAGARRS
jgi:thioredoxin 2